MTPFVKKMKGYYNVYNTNGLLIYTSKNKEDAEREMWAEYKKGLREKPEKESGV